MVESNTVEAASNNIKSPKLFISYSHDSPEHMDRVLLLSERLRDDGIDCSLDQYEVSPKQGWPRWTEDQIEQADYVLVICTEKYKQRFRLKEAQGQGLGVKWEGAVITQELYDAEANNTKFIPIVFTSTDTAHVPNVLRGTTRYELDTEGEYDKLYRHITNQPTVLKSRLGRLKPMPPRERRQQFQNAEDEVIIENNMSDEFVVEDNASTADSVEARDENLSRPAQAISSPKILRKHLATFIQIVVFLFAAFGGFLGGIAPPAEAHPKFAVGLSSFLVLIVLLFVSAISQRVSPAHSHRWIWAGAVCLVLVVVTGFLYPYMLSKYTYVYPPPPAEAVAWRINGDEYAEGAKNFIKENPGTYSPGELELELPYKDIWTAESIAKAKMILLINYIALVLSIATAVFCLLEANFKRRL
jgi:hypothetical protein